ncbi:MAG: DNA polymerase III subunit epsilon [Magnetococcales bacterium]|nr:DNA polymerase III subunit epsilon [Magnetococcales bacterium]
MRLIVLDTETTGFGTDEHRIVEIGCVELLGSRKGEQRQWYLNPERPIPKEATAVHGITDAKVADAPLFKQVAGEFLAFVGESTLVIHNAAFDMGFLNMELTRSGRETLPMSRAIDTVTLGKKRFPGATVSLDALCRRLGVDNTNRVLHGALLDAHLLAEVYVALTREGQYRLDLKDDPPPVVGKGESVGRKVYPARQWAILPEEEEAHRLFLALLEKESGGHCFWMQEPEGKG